MARTVLVVDDIAFVRKTLSDILKSAHYQVVGEAQNGLEAVDMYTRLKPDVVTMDIVMPELSGIEATRRIIKKFKDARIIMITAMDQEQLIMDAINAGARDYLVKPFTSTDVLRALDHLF